MERDFWSEGSAESAANLVQVSKIERNLLGGKIRTKLNLIFDKWYYYQIEHYQERPMIKSLCTAILVFGIALFMPAPSTALEGVRRPIFPAEVSQSMRQLISSQEMFSQYHDYMTQFPFWKYRAYEINGTIYYIDYPDLIKGQLLQEIPWEPVEAALMTEYVQAGDVAVDVGAHIGIHTMHLCSLVGSQGRVIAIEPQRKLYRELFYNLTANGFENATLFFNAIGNGSGSIELGLVEMGNEGARRCELGSKEFVDLRTIDSLNLEQLDFLKIEVNGMELDALAGAERTIARCRPKILIELWDVTAGTDWLEDHQYEVSHCAGLNYFALPVENQVPPEIEKEVSTSETSLNELIESESLET